LRFTFTCVTTFTPFHRVSTTVTFVILHTAFSLTLPVYALPFTFFCVLFTPLLYRLRYRVLCGLPANRLRLRLVAFFTLLRYCLYVYFPFTALRFGYVYYVRSRSFYFRSFTGLRSATVARGTPLHRVHLHTHRISTRLRLPPAHFALRYVLRLRAVCTAFTRLVRYRYAFRSATFCCVLLLPFWFTRLRFVQHVYAVTRFGLLPHAPYTLHTARLRFTVAAHVLLGLPPFTGFCIWFTFTPFVYGAPFATLVRTFTLYTAFIYIRYALRCGLRYRSCVYYVPTPFIYYARITYSCTLVLVGCARGSALRLFYTHGLRRFTAPAFARTALPAAHVLVTVSFARFWFFFHVLRFAYGYGFFFLLHAFGSLAVFLVCTVTFCRHWFYRSFPAPYAPHRTPPFMRYLLHISPHQTFHRRSFTVTLRLPRTTAVLRTVCGCYAPALGYRIHFAAPHGSRILRFFSLVLYARRLVTLPHTLPPRTYITAVWFTTVLHGSVVCSRTGSFAAAHCGSQHHRLVRLHTALPFCSWIVCTFTCGSYLAHWLFTTYYGSVTWFGSRYLLRLIVLPVWFWLSFTFTFACTFTCPFAFVHVLLPRVAFLHRLLTPFYRTFRLRYVSHTRSLHFTFYHAVYLPFGSATYHYYHCAVYWFTTVCVARAPLCVVTTFAIFTHVPAAPLRVHVFAATTRLPHSLHHHMRWFVSFTHFTFGSFTHTHRAVLRFTLPYFAFSYGLRTHLFSCVCYAFALHYCCGYGFLDTRYTFVTGCVLLVRLLPVVLHVWLVAFLRFATHVLRTFGSATHVRLRCLVLFHTVLHRCCCTRTFHVPRCVPHTFTVYVPVCSHHSFSFCRLRDAYTAAVHVRDRFSSLHRALRAFYLRSFWFYRLVLRTCTTLHLHTYQFGFYGYRSFTVSLWTWLLRTARRPRALHAPARSRLHVARTHHLRGLRCAFAVPHRGFAPHAVWLHSRCTVHLLPFCLRCLPTYFLVWFLFTILLHYRFGSVYAFFLFSRSYAIFYYPYVSVTVVCCIRLFVPAATRWFTVTWFAAHHTAFSFVLLHGYRSPPHVHAPPQFSAFTAHAVTYVLWFTAPSHAFLPPVTFGSTTRLPGLPLRLVRSGLPPWFFRHVTRVCAPACGTYLRTRTPAFVIGPLPHIPRRRAVTPLGFLPHAFTTVTHYHHTFGLQFPQFAVHHAFTARSTAFRSVYVARSLHVRLYAVTFGLRFFFFRSFVRLPHFLVLHGSADRLRVLRCIFTRLFYSLHRIPRFATRSHVLRTVLDWFVVTVYTHVLHSFYRFYRLLDGFTSFAGSFCGLTRLLHTVSHARYVRSHCLSVSLHRLVTVALYTRSTVRSWFTHVTFTVDHTHIYVFVSTRSFTYASHLRLSLRCHCRDTACHTVWFKVWLLVVLRVATRFAVRFCRCSVHLRLLVTFTVAVCSRTPRVLFTFPLRFHDAAFPVRLRGFYVLTPRARLPFFADRLPFIVLPCTLTALRLPHLRTVFITRFRVLGCWLLSITPHNGIPLCSLRRTFARSVSLHHRFCCARLLRCARARLYAAALRAFTRAYRCCWSLHSRSLRVAAARRFFCVFRTHCRVYHISGSFRVSLFAVHSRVAFTATC